MGPAEAAALAAQRGYLPTRVPLLERVGAVSPKEVCVAGGIVGSRLGRGHVAARFAGRGLGVNARRVTSKARPVNLAQAGPRSTAVHLRYIEREGRGVSVVA